MSSLSLLEIEPLGCMVGTFFFSHAVGYLFIMLMVSFAMQRLVSFIRVPFCIFLFLVPWTGDTFYCHVGRERCSGITVFPWQPATCPYIEPVPGTGARNLSKKTRVRVFS